MRRRSGEWRRRFGQARVDHTATRPEVAGLTADHANGTDLHLFARAYPGRFFRMGMAAQRMTGAADGRC